MWCGTEREKSWLGRQSRAEQEKKGAVFRDLVRKNERTYCKCQGCSMLSREFMTIWTPLSASGTSSTCWLSPKSQLLYELAASVAKCCSTAFQSVALCESGEYAVCDICSPAC